MKIKEIIIVEGRDDTAAVKRAVDAQTIETHGFGIKKQTWELIEKAYQERGIIIFTDPDYAGKEIRRRLTKAFPGAGQAYLSKGDAEKDGDIGIENAAPDSIRQALEKAHYTLEDKQDAFTMSDLIQYGLTADPKAAERREQLGKRLGIGYGNSKAFLNKLNRFGITRDEFFKHLREI